MLNPERFVPEIAFSPRLWLLSHFGFNALGHLGIVVGTSLAVEWLRLTLPSEEIQSLVREPRSHMLYVAAKKKKKKKKAGQTRPIAAMSRRLRRFEVPVAGLTKQHWALPPSWCTAPSFHLASGPSGISWCQGLSATAQGR